MNEEAI